jgi:endonuclease/exonuclease/phosphatase family metal-dependent hydrolase
MMRGLDRDGSSLALAPALQLDGRSAATWRDAEPRPSGPIFTPGRLDYVLFGDATLALERALVFDSAQLPVSWAEAHGVQSDDNHRASDHLPVVADFRWRAGQ